VTIAVRSLNEAMSSPSPPASDRPIIAIQARMGSTRFPGKVMAELEGRPVLDWVYERANASLTQRATVVLTSTSNRDDIIEEWARRLGVACFRGSESDVLSRYVEFSRHQRPPAVVRITADCPLVDPDVIDSVIAAWWRKGDPAEYASNTLCRTFPDGLDVEVISAEALEKLDWVAVGDQREHVTSYVIENTAEFDCVSVELDVDCSSARVTVDTPDDLDSLAALVRGVRRPTEGPRLEAILAHFGCLEN
jgi:spore coat polysaccharide biosynthesis protein SpsF